MLISTPLFFENRIRFKATRPLNDPVLVQSPVRVPGASRSPLYPDFPGEPSTRRGRSWPNSEENTQPRHQQESEWLSG